MMDASTEAFAKRQQAHRMDLLLQNLKAAQESVGYCVKAVERGEVLSGSELDRAVSALADAKLGLAEYRAAQEMFDLGMVEPLS